MTKAVRSELDVENGSLAGVRHCDDSRTVGRAHVAEDSSYLVGWGEHDGSALQFVENGTPGAHRGDVGRCDGAAPPALTCSAGVGFVGAQDGARTDLSHGERTWSRC